MQTTPDELIASFEKQSSLAHFLTTFSETSIPSVYRNQTMELTLSENKQLLLVINGTTGSGKDTLIHLLEKNGIAENVQTATNRPKRPREPASNYLWMRQKKDSESAQEYYHNLVQEYDLIEHDLHAGNVYGLPRKNLKMSSAENPILIQNEPHGAKTLLNTLSFEYNVVVFFLVPDSWKTILNRVKREGHQRDKLIERLNYSHEQLSLSQDTTHFYVHSTTHPEQYGNPQKLNGINFLYESVAATIGKLINFETNF